MIIFPAIDIKGGRCVRLLKGNFSKITKYNKPPLEQAKELNLWSIVRNYTSWRKSFDNNENVLNTINKAIQNASTST